MNKKHNSLWGYTLLSNPIFLILFFLNLTNNLNSQGLNSIVTSDGVNIYAVGDSGKVLSSTNAGSSWFLKIISLSNLKSAYSIDQNIWIAGNGGNIYKITADDSVIFHFSLSENIALSSIYFPGANTGFVCGENGKIYKTSNGGINWNLSNKGVPKVLLNSLVFKDNLNGYVVGKGGIICKTIDGGQVWNLENSNTNHDLLKVKYFGDSIVCCGKNGALLIKGKGSWTSIDTRQKGDLRGLAVDNLKKIHVCGGAGFIRNNKNGSTEFLNFEPNPMLTNLTDMFYFDNDQGYAVSSSNNAIIKTTNGGANWKFANNVTMHYVWENKISGQQNGFGNSLALHPYNKNTIFVAYTNKLFVSRDKGESWNIISILPFTVSRSSSLFISALDTNVWLESVITSNDCPVIRTTDYGLSWQIVLDSVLIGSYTKPLEMDQNIPGYFYYATSDKGFFRSTDNGNSFSQVSNFKFNNPCDLTVQYENSNNLLLADASYPVIDSSKIYKSTDGGFNWSLKFKVGDSEIPTITNSIFDYNKSWAAAEKLYSSSNFGETWTGIANSFDVLWALDICKEDPTCIFTARFSGQGFLSTNGGISFSNVNHPNSSVFFSAVLFPERDYAIGMFNNSVYKLKFTYDVTVGIVKTPGIVPDNFILYQNYPNPFNPKTTIYYSIPVSGYVTLEIFDALGKEVYSLVNQKQYSGNYKAEFDGINLTSGIYFYQLRSGKFSETKKMLLIK